MLSGLIPRSGRTERFRTHVHVTTSPTSCGFETSQRNLEINGLTPGSCKDRMRVQLIVARNALACTNEKKRLTVSMGYEFLGAVRRPPVLFAGTA